MRPLFVLVFCLFLAGFSFSQDISVSFVDNPERPLEIENPASGKTLLLFAPEFSGKNRTYACKAYECDSRTLQVLRTGPENNIYARGESTAPVRMRVLCRVARGADYYFAIENAGACQLYRVSGADLQLEKVDSVMLRPKEHVIKGIADDGQMYILSSWKKKKKRSLMLYSLSPGGRMESRPVKLPLKSDKVIDELFNRNFYPAVVEYGMEREPRNASLPVKMFATPGKIRITFDDGVVGSDNTGTIAAMLKIVVIDLAKDSLYLERHYYADRLLFNPVEEGRSSYIFENRLFQMYFNDEMLLLRVRDLESGQSLYKYSIAAGDSLRGLANSPILVPGRGLFGIEREQLTTRDLLRRFARFKPFLQVRRDGERLLLCLGGYDRTDLPLYVPFAQPIPGLTLGVVFDLSYERSFAFYSVLDAAALTPLNIFYQKPLYSVYSDKMETLQNPKDQALYRIGGRFYLGYFDKSSKHYRFREVGVESR